MALTREQLETLNVAIQADPVLAGLKGDSDGASLIAVALNLPAEPPFVVWKTAVPTQQVGNAIVSTDLVSLDALQVAHLQLLISFAYGSFNPSVPETQKAFDIVFSGSGAEGTRTALQALWKRPATVGEKVFAEGGDGSDGSPATLTFEGLLSYQDVQAARGF